MCGIAGFVDPSLEPVERRHEILDRMCRSMRHRGPDDQGVSVDVRAALGMRRLAIIDPEGGQQPMANEGGTILAVCNGEIYNYRELRADLEARGHRFLTRSDTEVLPHLYEEYGASCVESLRGMFALAIWDARDGMLFLARDRAGEKPLFYTLTPRHGLAFGSELKALLQYPGVERKLHLPAAEAYLSLGYVPDPLCIFEGIRKLPPGCWLQFRRGEVTLQQYWDFPCEPAAEHSEEVYIEQLRALLDESVRMRLVSDVPLGAFLSGGIDSSLVVALMSRHLRQPVKTFSIGFEEAGYSELEYARQAAARFGADHHELIVTPDMCELVEKLAWHFDEPFADSSAIPTYLVSKLARGQVTVALSGDGGDELFAGYTRYVEHRRRDRLERVPWFLRRRVAQPLSRRLPHHAWGRNYLYNMSLDSLDRYIDSISIFTSLNAPLLYSSDFRRALYPHQRTRGLLRDHATRVRSGAALERQLYLDSKTYLPGDILTKVDRMSMAVSLESRAPLLDHRLMEAASQVPAALKLRGQRSKHILRRAVSDLVPREILERPKQGFAVPIRRWLNGPLRDHLHGTLSEARTRERGYFDPRYIRVLLEEHQRGRRDHSTALWTLLMFELWHQQFLDAPPALSRRA